MSYKAKNDTNDLNGFSPQNEKKNRPVPAQM